MSQCGNGEEATGARSHAEAVARLEAAADLSGRIRDARKECGLTQLGLAKAIGVARETVCDWETGKTSPRPIQLAAIIRVLKGCPNRALRPNRRIPAWPHQGTRIVSNEEG